MPLLYVNITPINPNGVTVVDLGEMYDGLEKTERDSASSEASDGTEGNDEVAPLRTANGAMLPRSSVGIKNENTIKTRWFTVWNKTSISKPYTLHTDVQLELGDLFINKFYSEQHQTQALQVWLLVKRSNSNNFMWRQVDPTEITFHPNLKTHILGFQPNDTSIPSWIKPSTDRSSRAKPLIVNGRG